MILLGCGVSQASKLLEAFALTENGVGGQIQSSGIVRNFYLVYRIRMIVYNANNVNFKYFRSIWLWTYSMSTVFSYKRQSTDSNNLEKSI